jgi:hypothetical protein
MTVLTLQLSDNPVITRPSQLASQVGFKAGQVQIIFGKQSFIVTPVAASNNDSDTTDWDAYTKAYQELVTPYYTSASSAPSVCH